MDEMDNLVDVKMVKDFIEGKLTGGSPPVTEGVEE